MDIIYLSFSNLYNTANTVQVLNMCDSLTAHGKVTLFCYNQSKRSRSVKDFYNLRNKFKIVSLYSYPIVKYFLNLFLITNHIVSYRKTNLLIYTRVYYYALIFSYLGFNVVYEKHALSSSLFERISDSLLLSFQLVNLVVISQLLAQYYHIKFPKTNIIKAHDCAPLQSKLCLNKNKFRVCYIGSLLNGKGLQIIIEVIKCLPDIQFVLAGKCDKKTISFLKSFRNLIYKGECSFSDCQKLMQESSVGLNPTQNVVTDMLYHPWQSPLKLFEYMSFGCAIISSNHSMYSDVLSKDNSLLIDDFSNATVWCEAILLLKNNSKLREKITSNSYNLHKNIYNWDTRSSYILNESSYS